MFAAIAPHAHFPHTTESLEYHIPEELRSFVMEGTLVRVPLRKTSVPGVVLEVYEHSRMPEEKAKLRASIEEVLPVSLPPAYAKTLVRSAREFATTPMWFSDALLPEPLKKSKKISSKEPSPEEPSLKHPPSSAILYEVADTESALLTVQDLVTAVRKKKQQLLILVPRLEDMKAVAKEVQKIEGMRTATLPEKRSKGALWKLFEEAARGEIDVFITTRKGVIYPLPRLGSIIIYREEYADHKQYDMKPRYDARVVAEILGETTGASIAYISEAPRLTTRIRVTPANTKRVGTFGTPEVLLHLAENPRELVPQQTVERIAETLEDGGRVLILGGSDDDARLLSCKACKAALECPTCHVPAKWVSASGAYACRFCGFAAKVPQSCPACGVVATFRAFGLGNAFISADLHKMLSDISTKNLFVLSDWHLAEQQLPRAWYEGWDLVVWLHPEFALNSTEFNAEERTEGRMLRIVRKLRSNATCAIVSTKPHRIFASLLKEREAAYFEALANERKALLYPPFGRFAKCIIQGETRRAAEEKADELARTLENLPGIRVLGPYDASPAIVRGKYRILIAIHGEPSAVEAVLPELTKLHDAMLIDVDPERLFR